MKNKQAYREQFIALKQVLQKHDPLNYVALYDAERFGKDLYGCEATTLLEKHAKLTKEADIERFLIGCKGSKEGISLEATRNAAIEIRAVLDRF